MLTLQALTYIEGNNQTCGSIWNYATGILTADHVIQLNCGDVYASMEVIKQPEHGKIQQPRNKKHPTFRGTLINS